ncbi:hypothetical protein GAYE_SCF56G6412 [Galdieria yellowstonensis]|uniref:2Fe-2S ferredoxin n=1 Tax=Galdieria yellowstonensis TaxID=3028027 RepID=A0AAV9IEP6_9RHOD|nr:hypothetical protein GAYE_SCF18G3821 [Galdieria yellowstonensis]KAK4528469.1 hypothetical protein GAYE_SCF56G6412 [Galdieria yellowstonensis]
MWTCRSARNLTRLLFSPRHYTRFYVTEPQTCKETIRITFVLQDGTKKQVEAPIGKHILELAHENDIDLEGACEGSLACSTCHVYLDEQSYNKLPEPSDDENDMLDLAFGLTEYSRLGCQVVASPELDGMVITLPPATRNMMVDGHVSKH